MDGPVVRMGPHGIVECVIGRNQTASQIASECQVTAILPRCPFGADCPVLRRLQDWRRRMPVQGNLPKTIEDGATLPDHDFGHAQNVGFVRGDAPQLGHERLGDMQRVRWVEDAKEIKRRRVVNVSRSPRWHKTAKRRGPERSKP